MVLSSILQEKMYLPLLLAIVSIFNKVYADPPYQYCQYAKNNRFFADNIKHLLPILSSNASTSKFFNTSTGTDPHNKAYGQFLCINYVTPQACNNCIKLVVEAIENLCPNSSDATVWEEVCQLRVSDKQVFGHLSNTGYQTQYNPGRSVSDPERFRSVVNNTLFQLTQEAAYKSSEPVFYATKKVAFSDGDDYIYSLVQCTPGLSSDDCKICLETAIGIVLVNYTARGGRFLGRNCLLRYEFYDFISGIDHSRASPHHLKKWIKRLLEIGLTSTLIVALGTYSCYYAIRNWRKGSEQTAHLLQLQHIGIDYEGGENPFMEFTTIYAATDNFSEANKLGEGGFGPVYKGTLRNGKQVAVKRLSHSSEQGIKEFTNELLLIWQLQHKNLVKLLGFCVEGQERLLAYEYMPNKGLDYFLYDPARRAQLTWAKRLQIIHGIARGILYLHEDSRLRIIHRDLKPSNVLLDTEMNPKISDLGIARIYGGSDNEANTAIIVGTYGYMAPEYAMEGIYSAKSDVFSFGVILLEILLGRKSIGFHFSGNGPSLQAYAWQEWSHDRGVGLMDPLLTDSCNPDEFLRCLHVGLLCVQEDAFDRPSMSSVVQMLASESATPRPPNRPAFSVGKFSDHYEASSKMFSTSSLTASENPSHNE